MKGSRIEIPEGPVQRFHMSYTIPEPLLEAIKKYNIKPSSIILAALWREARKREAIENKRIAGSWVNPCSGEVVSDRRPSWQLGPRRK